MRIYIGFVTLGFLIVLGIFSLHSASPAWFFHDGVEAASIPAAPHAVVLFGGDMMFDRSIRTSVLQNGGDYIFACLDPLLKSEDLVVANLEGPITDNSSISEYSQPGDGRNYTFTFPTSTAALLFAHNVKLVNMGNNHILNFGYAGAESTEMNLTKAGVGYFGDPFEQTVAEENVQGVLLAFINYNQFWYKSSASTTLAQIRTARAKGEIPIVYTHWGEEYQMATDKEKLLAHAFIDEGADMVIGSHPHVVQEHELYKDKNIYYSLGNLIFDQYWEDAVDHGLMVEVQFDSSGATGVREIPVVLGHDRRTCREAGV